MLTLPNLLVAVPAALDLKKSIILWYVERLRPLPCRIDRIVSRRSPVPALICGCTRLVWNGVILSRDLALVGSV